MELLTKENIRKINKEALGEKHGCSGEYVRQILNGSKSQETEKAKAIIEDAEAIIKVLVGNTNKNQESHV